MKELDNNIEFRKFNVSEIFYSIQGEGLHMGKPCVFVRMQGCELRCIWCDTPYALDIKQKEKTMTSEEIIAKIRSFDCNYVLFTGGEPLLQTGVDGLMNYLVDKGYEVAVETNGHQDILILNDSVIKVMDLKAPASGMSDYNNFENLNYLSKKDEIKIIIADRGDYEWSKKIILDNKLHKLVNSIILSPVFVELSPAVLAEWILEDSLPVRMLLQMHKFIWESNKKGV
jgi:7-carboxy-7-deazaguanine synthase